MTCPSWEYENVPNYKPVLVAAVEVFLRQLRAKSIDTRIVACETRPTHKLYFERLTPPHHPQYAGHYRGEDKPCIKTYEVMIPSDPRVGTKAIQVLAEMSRFSHQVSAAVSALDAGANTRLPPELKLRNLVAVACLLLEKFCRIHPYANGNGHIGRTLVWLLLARYNYFPHSWPIEPKPPDPPYSRLIADARSGDREALENYILNCIIGPALVT